MPAAFISRFRDDGLLDVWFTAGFRSNRSGDGFEAFGECLFAPGLSPKEVAVCLYVYGVDHVIEEHYAIPASDWLEAEEL